MKKSSEFALVYILCIFFKSFVLDLYFKRTSIYYSMKMWEIKLIIPQNRHVFLFYLKTCILTIYIFLKTFYKQK